jgi:dTDP-glucose 4,6-dehydratase
MLGSLKNKNVIVTGGAGFLGSHLCERLVKLGAKVICLDNFLTGKPENVGHLVGNPNFELIKHDVTTDFYIARPIYAILHFASPASPIDYLKLPFETLKVGAMGTFNALDLARAKNAKYLLASTSEVYGDPLVHPQQEDYWGNVNPNGPRSCYDEA